MGPSGISPSPNHSCEISIQLRGMITEMNASISVTPVNRSNQAWRRSELIVVRDVTMQTTKPREIYEITLKKGYFVDQFVFRVTYNFSMIALRRGSVVCS